MRWVKDTTEVETLKAMILKLQVINLFLRQEGIVDFRGICVH